MRMIVDAIARRQLTDRDETDPSERRARWVVLTTIFALSIFPVVFTPVVPVIDFYNHVARYFVLSHVENSQFLSENYISAWAILPNIGLDILASSISRYVDQRWLDNIIVILIMAVQYFGIIYFNRSITKEYSVVVAIIAALLLYSFVFTWGFANFLLGLGLVFWAAGWAIRIRDRPLLALPVSCVLALGIFLTHGVAFALYGLLMGGIELGFFWAAKPRRLTALGRSMAGLALQAIAPAVLFRLSATSSVPGGVTNVASSVETLSKSHALAERLHDLLIYRITTIVRVAESPSLPLDVLSFFGVIALIAFLILRGRAHISTVCLPAIAIAMLLVACVPPTMFGVGYIADRMPLFLAFLLTGGLRIQLMRRRFDAVVVGLLVLILAVRLLVTGVSWSRSGMDLIDFNSVANAIPPKQVVAYVDVKNVGRQSARSRCEMYGPLLVTLHGLAAPLFANNGQQPLVQTGKLATAVRDLPMPVKSQRVGNFWNNRLEIMAAQKRFDYVLICDASDLKRPLPATAEKISQQGRFTLLRLTKLGA